MDTAKFLEEKALLIDKAIEKYIPRKFSADSIVKHIIHLFDG